MAELLSQALEVKKQKVVEFVNMGEKLSNQGLDRFFPSQSWPPAAAVRELHHRARMLEKAGVKRPFVASDLPK